MAETLALMFDRLRFSAMADALTQLLDDVRPRGALFARSFMRPPWALRFEDDAPLAVVAMLDGDGWLDAGDGEPVALGSGDVAIVVGVAPYTVSQQPGAAPRVVVHDPERCTEVGGRRFDETTELCSHTPTGADEAVLLHAAFPVHGSVRGRLLDGLPRVLVVRRDELPHSALASIEAELRAARPGQRAVLDRLLELLLVTTLREWLDRSDTEAPPWFQAQKDPIVGAALQLIHDEPARPWTVAELARATAVSRAAFARRFAELVGEPPMTYLACWRMCLAADLLRETDDTVGTIASQVGYANAYALSVAFKRIHGVRPSDFRAAAA